VKTNGNAGSVSALITTAGQLTLTPTAYNAALARQGAPATLTGNALPIGLRLQAGDVENEAFGRYTILVDGVERNLPADTTLLLAPGQHTIGIKLNQTNIENIIALYQNNVMKGIVHEARTTTPLTINSDASYEVQLIRKGKPHFSGSERESYQRVYLTDTSAPSGPGFLRPAVLTNFEVYLHDGTLILNGTEPVCGPMSAASRAGWMEAIDSLRSQDKDANGVNRRTFAVIPGNLPESKKIQRQIGGNTGIGLAPGTILLCDHPQGSIAPPSGSGLYDNSGFLDTWFARYSANISMAKWTELFGFIDQNNNGAEETVNVLWSRHGQSAASLDRNATQQFVYNHVTRLSIDAGRSGYGLIKLP
jgi:hypothetical protein